MKSIVLRACAVFVFVAGTVPFAFAQKASAAVKDFSFIHMSDIHVDPWLEMPTDEQLMGGRSYKSVRTIEKLNDVFMEPFGFTAPKPSFIIATGDICEFSAPGPTWEVVQRYFKGLQKYYLAPGNHDNTWAASTDHWRAAWGGINYSFEHNGIHFMALNSASMLDPNPSFSQEVIEFVKNELKKVGPNKPVIPYFHHPLNGSEFASRYDVDRLLDAFRPYNILLIMDGHGHSPVTHYFWGIDGVEGGSTFSKLSALTDGYNIADVRDGMISVAYKKVFETSATRKLIQKQIPSSSGYPKVTIDSPADGSVVTSSTVDLRAKISTDVVSAVYHLDDETSGEMTVTKNTAQANIETSRILNGAHYVRVVFKSPGGVEFQRSGCFFLEAGTENGPAARWRFQMTGGSKTTPLVTGGRVYVGSNDSYLYAVNEKSGKLAWKYKADGEIVGSPSLYKNTIVFGDLQGSVHAVDLKGKRRWSKKLPKPIYTAAVIDGDSMYVSGRDAWVFALNAQNGEELWRNTEGSYSIESRPFVTEKHLYIGAWDGHIYCIDKATGKTEWKAWGPHNQSIKGNLTRYYAPADNGPVVTSGTVFVTDRASVAGSYTTGGDFNTTISSDCSALALSADQQSLYLRSIKAPVSKVDLQGNEIWKSEAKGGRIPISPIEVDGAVYVCSNTGTLQAIDAATGELRWSYQVTPKLFVMAGVTVANGSAYVCGLDGRLTAVRLP